MQNKPANPGNERYYQDVVAAEAADQARHNTLFTTHADAYNRYFDLLAEFDETYVRENFPDLADAVDKIHASLGALQKSRSESTERRDNLIKSLVSEIVDIASRNEKHDDPIIRLRSDLRELSKFRSDKLDGVFTDFWVLNVTNHVTRDRKSISGQIMKAWCKTAGIKPTALDDTMHRIAPLFDQHPSRINETSLGVAEALDDYLFDAEALLAEAQSWPECNEKLLSGVVTCWEDRKAAAPTL